MEKKKLKMANRTLRKILIPFMAIFLVLILILNAAASLAGSTLDTYLGAGAKSIVGGNGADANYYPTEFSSNDQSTEAAYAVAKRVAEEGSVLLKNNGVLPLQKGSTVVPFGYAYQNPIYGQLTSGGSAKWVINPVTPEQGLSAFTIDAATAERMNGTQVEILTEAPGTKEAGAAGSMLGGDCKIYEYNASIYDGLSAIPGSTGIVFVTRSGQEGQDQKYDAYTDGTPHYLALSENEKGAIAAAKRICDRVVLVLVSSAPMELGPVADGELECDAILWIGHPGERGFATLSDLLDGDVNPSGRTVDTYSRDFTLDPSYQNLGLFEYSNLTTTSGAYAYAGAPYARRFTEYQEGVYMGYRYYETADLVDPDFDYDAAVIYPFGYGLSYTTFTQELVSVESDGYTVTAVVKVTNTGNAAGKEVVQLYFAAPHTDFDVQNKIEKPAVQLVAFDKSQLLKAGESETVTLTFTTDDMTSYCYTHENPDGTKGCYVLENGDYVISLRKNSHEVIDEKPIVVAETIWYDGSDDAHVRKTDRDAQTRLNADGTLSGERANPNATTWTNATNQFQTSSDYMNTDSVILSRADWKNTQPKMAENRTKEISPQFADQLGIETSFDVETDPNFGNVPGSLVYAEQPPVSKAKNGLTVSMMRGADYYDSRWEQLLDQIDWDADKDGLILSFAGAAYTTGAVESIGLPGTVDQDGANGLKVNGAGDGGYDMTKSSSFGFAPLMAATWNTDLIYEVGAAFGQESLQNGINGWYCPAINLHRSFFNGRVFEYYSEDPVLSGKLAASVISGAGEMGMFCYVKHFALNDTETGRDVLTNFWADEQTMRELYLKAFEIAFKEAKCTIRYYDESGNMTSKVMRAATAVMPAQNCVGTVVGHANYNLLTNVLRGEWGFTGVVVSDYWVWDGNNLRDLCLRTGCDTYLCMAMPMMWTVGDYDSATARSVMRNAIHNLAYTVANSNAMQGYAPGAVQKVAMSPWRVGILVFTIVFGLLIAGGIVWLVLRRLDEKKNPDKYKHSSTRKERREAKKAKKAERRALKAAKREKRLASKPRKIVKTVLSALAALILAAILIAANTLLPTYGRMVNEILTYKQAWNTPATDLDLMYNKADFTEAESKTLGQSLNEQIAGEGIVLLQNDGALPLKGGTTLSLFSHSSVDVLAGGYSGSSLTLKSALESRGFAVNEALWKFYSEGSGKDYTRGVGSINYGRDEDFRINECPIEVITAETGLEDTFAGTTAVYVWSRVVGEGRDMPRSMYNHTSVDADKSKNYLEPDSVELGVLNYLNEHFDNVILLVNSPAVMELGWTKEMPHITAVIQMGLPGTFGLNALADILAGKVNPSGHLVDTIAYDGFSSPAAQNYGDYQYVDEAGNLTRYSYLSYAEGIYVGYRYYETRYEDAILGQGNVGDYDYDATVQYPFGYGLSYTTFDWSDYAVTETEDGFDVSVTVTNTGAVPGKDVVEVYLQSPYTDYDKANCIEKSAVELVAYAKTGTLAPNASETVTAHFDKEQLKVYDSHGAKTFIIDAGDYYITAASDAHKAVNNILAAKGAAVDGNADFAFTYTVADFDATTYAIDSYSGAAVTNLFDEEAGDLVYLSRSDWTGTFPKHDGIVSSFPSTWGNEINGSDGGSYVYVKTATAAELARMDGTDSGNPIPDSTFTTLPTYGANNGVELIDLRGLDYDDPLWETLLDELTEADTKQLVNYSGYGTPDITSVQKPYALDADSATGLVFGNVSGVTFSGAEVLAQTWNIELAEQFGDFIGNSALLGGVSGWYSPAMNLHRTPFSGRNNEYYSEDPFISGAVAAASMKAAANKGMYTFIKHFALNDQENHRGDTETEWGACTWANEQSIRELYLKPFEMCMKAGNVTLHYVKDGALATREIRACQALMTSFNRLGYTWTGGHYNLITGILRNEWAFNGFIITDADTPTHMDPVQMIKAGADGKLNYQASYELDLTDPATAHYAREASHRILYTLANSKAMNGAMHGSQLTGTPTATILRVVLSVVSVLLIALLIFFTIRRFTRKPKATIVETK